MNVENQKRHVVNSENELLQLSNYFVQVFPEMNQLEQKTALALYRLLALGKAVSLEQLAGQLNESDAVVAKILKSWAGIFYDDEHNIIDFWGLTIREMPHSMVVNDIKVFIWCAWDALFIPELLAADVKIISTCPVTKEKINLEVNSDGVKSSDNKEIVVSILKPDVKSLENITSNFCYFVYFFSNLAIGEQWCDEHPNTFLLSLGDAFSIGKRMNGKRYNLTL